MRDKRHPKLEKIGCYFQGEKRGFEFFKKYNVKNNDVFIYKDGILWRVRR